MAVLIGSARSSFGNTTPGDQHSGLEVSAQNWYLHSKGWYVLRAKDAAARERIAVAMERACANNNIGYSQPTRNTLYTNVKPYGFDPALTTKKVNTDCSALVRVCVNYAGITVGDFITSNEVSVLMATGAFDKLTDGAHCKSSDHLLRGDILVTRTKGHTVVVLSNGAKARDEVVSVAYKLGDRILKNGMDGDDVKELQTYLIGLDYECGIWGADGEFGDATEQAVERFQTARGCAVDGEVGPETLAALKRALEETEATVKDTRYVKIVNGDCYVRTAPNAAGKEEKDVKQIEVTGATVNLREGPGTNYGVVKVVKKGDRLYAIAEENGWIPVLVDGNVRWIKGNYTKEAE